MKDLGPKKLIYIILPLENDLGNRKQSCARLDKKLFNFSQKVVQLFRKVEQLFSDGLGDLLRGLRRSIEMTEIFVHFDRMCR